MNRFVRSSPQRSPLLSAVLSGGAVVVVAVAFAVAGVDDVEVLATLFFAPVFVAALLGGRNAGFAAAAVATLSYLALRSGDIEDSGALRVGLLVAARAVCYGVVAQATPSLQRFAGLSGVGMLGKASPRHQAVAASVSALAATADVPPADSMYRPELVGGPEHRESAEYPQHPQVGAESERPASDATPWTEPPAGEPAWDPPQHEPEPAWNAPQTEQPGWSAPEQEWLSGWDPPQPEQEPAWTSPQQEWGEAPVPEPAEPVGSAELEPAAAGTWDAPVDEAPDLWRAPAEPVGAPGPMAGHGAGWPGHAGPPPPPPGAPDTSVRPVEWDDPQPEAGPARFMSPPAPTVPTGWVDDATVPLGDETIPVGYTGELFLPRELRQPHLSPPEPMPRNGSTNGGPHPPSPPFGSVPTSVPGPAHMDPGVPPEPPPYNPPPYNPLPEPPPFGTPPVEQPGAQAADAASAGAPSVTSGPGGPGVGSPLSEPPPTPRQPGAPRTGAETSGPQSHRRFTTGPLEGDSAAGGVDPETRLWNARFFRNRLASAREESRQTGSPFSVVMVQVADQPFQPLPYRRQVALLRELGHQFIRARMIDHLVHLPDGAQHWFAAVLPDTGRTDAHLLERRLRSAIASYLRSRGLHLTEVQSASLTSPDDDEAMGAVWASLLGSPSVG